MTAHETDAMAFLQNTWGGTIIGRKPLADIVSESQDLATMTNPALAVLVTNYVWGKLPLESPESVLLAEVIARLRGKETA
jgi:hypothetical protein